MDQYAYPNSIVQYHSVKIKVKVFTDGLKLASIIPLQFLRYDRPILFVDEILNFSCIDYTVKIKGYFFGIPVSLRLSYVIVDIVYFESIVKMMGICLLFEDDTDNCTKNLPS